MEEVKVQINQLQILKVIIMKKILFILNKIIKIIKILEEEKFTSDKRYQLIQQKYDILLEENKMIKNKVKEEKEYIEFTIEELQKENNLKKDEIIKEFKEKTNLITQNFIFWGFICIFFIAYFITIFI